MPKIHATIPEYPYASLRKLYILVVRLVHNLQFFPPLPAHSYKEKSYHAFVQGNIREESLLLVGM